MVKGYQRIWIIGGGKFGFRAAEKMKEKYPDARLFIVDDDVDTCLKFKRASYDIVCMDGISFLSDRLLPNTHLPDWIVPAAPIHIAFQWVRNKLVPDYDVRLEDIPDNILSQLPNPIRGKNKEVYMSLADFICPDNCPEPVKICTVTQKPRPYSLFEHLGQLADHGFSSVVIRSRQLAPGVGGYKPEALFAALDQVKIAEKKILFSSACRCHGVMNGFSIKKRGG